MTTPSTMVPTAVVTTEAPAPTLRVAVTGPLSGVNWWAALGSEGSALDRLMTHGMTASLFVGTAHEPAADLAMLPLAVPRPDGDGWVVDQRIAADRRWSDGRPIVAGDLTFYLDTVRSFSLDGSHAYPTGVVSVEAPDDHTIRIRYERAPGPDLWPGEIGRVPFVPSHHWEALLADIHDRPALYGLEAPAPPGAMPETVSWVVAGSREDAYRLLMDGQVDFVHDPVGTAGLPAGLLDDLRETAALTTSVRSPVRVLAMNQRVAPFDDPAMRLALATIVDRVELAGMLGATPAYSFYRPDSIAPAGPGTFDGERLDLAARVDAAVTILEEAGYTWATRPAVVGREVEGGSALRRPNGSPVGPLRLLVSDHDSMRVEAAAWIAGRADLIGVEMEVVPTPDLAGIVLPPLDSDASRGWAIALLGWRWTGPADPVGLMIHLFHSSEDSYLAGGTNVTGLASATFDDLADRYRVTTSPSKAVELAAAMEAVALQEAAQLPLYRETITEAHAAGLPFVPVVDGIHADPRSWPFQSP
jgi:ABC-type transport system substrate-binding protein